MATTEPGVLTRHACSFNLTKRRSQMTLRRRIQILAVAIVLSTVLLASDVAKPATTFTFEGCWTRYQVDPCLDVFRDDQGNYWICKACGTTTNPGPNKCTLTNLTALSRGFWCS